MSYVHKKFDGICTDMKSETIKVFFPYIQSECVNNVNNSQQNYNKN